MKKIIDGKAYNTETATLLATAPLSGRKIDRERPGVIIAGSEGIVGESRLFETRSGEYFLERDYAGDGVIPDPDYIGSMFSPVTLGLYPLTRKQALAWAESKEFDSERIQSIFGKVAETGEKSGSMLLRLPKTLKAAIDQAAVDADQSANTWAMRCLERCAKGKALGEALGEILFAAGPYEKEYTEAQLTEKFDYVREKAEELVELLGLGDQADLLYSAVEKRSWDHYLPKWEIS